MLYPDFWQKGLAQRFSRTPPDQNRNLLIIKLHIGQIFAHLTFQNQERPPITMSRIAAPLSKRGNPPWHISIVICPWGVTVKHQVLALLQHCFFPLPCACNFALHNPGGQSSGCAPSRKLFFLQGCYLFR